jgi:PAS domain S-box-containing protein
MALLTQNHNWTTTPVGAIETWPQSLRTALSIVLQSAFPMLLFWGKDLIAFYNDPYTKILQTDNRHPALGKKAVDIWPEGWETVKPLLEKVYYEGETVHFEDMLIPVLRKGQMEDVYWTFKYSPFYGDNEEIAGVIVSCAETTEKVNNYKRLQEQKEELEFAIEATELGTWDVDPIHNTLKTNKRLKEWFGLAPDDQVSLSSATDNIIEPDRQRVLEAINNALQYESGGQYDIEYTIINPVTKTERIVRAKGRSWFNEDKIAYRFNGTLQDVTQQVIARKKVEQSEQRFRNLVEEAIVSTAILTGPDMVLELANEAMLNIWGRNRSVIGKPLLEIMPELKGQPFPKILAEVYDAGKEFVAEGALVQLEKNGKLEDVYMDFSYKPLKEEDNNITGILVMATDVTERVLTNRRLQQSEENLRNTILKAPVAMAIFKGEKFVTEIANEKMLELWGKKAEEVLDKPTFEAMPEVKEQGFDTILKEVYTTGRSYADQGIPLKLMREGKMDVVFLNFVFEAYRGPDGFHYRYYSSSD